MEKRENKCNCNIKSGDWVKLTSGNTSVVGRVVFLHPCDFYEGHKLVAIHGFNVWFGVDDTTITKLTKDQIDMMELL